MTLGELNSVDWPESWSELGSTSESMMLVHDSDL